MVGGTLQLRVLDRALASMPPLPSTERWEPPPDMAPIKLCQAAPPSVEPEHYGRRHEWVYPCDEWFDPCDDEDLNYCMRYGGPNAPVMHRAGQLEGTVKKAIQ